jgi:hypothetical protein
VGLARVESLLEQTAELLARRQDVVALAARRQLHDADLVGASAVAAGIRRSLVESYDCRASAEDAHPATIMAIPRAPHSIALRRQGEHEAADEPVDGAEEGHGLLLLQAFGSGSGTTIRAKTT